MFLNDLSDSSVLRWLLLVGFFIVMLHFMCACAPARRTLVDAHVAGEYSTPLASSSVMLRLRVEVVPALPLVRDSDSLDCAAPPFYRVVVDSIHTP